jgi:hypothetical protein
MGEKLLDKEAFFDATNFFWARFDRPPDGG